MWSQGWGFNPVWLVSFLEEERTPGVWHREEAMWEKWENSQMQTKEKGLKRNKSC